MYIMNKLEKMNIKMRKLTEYILSEEEIVFDTVNYKELKETISKKLMMFLNSLWLLKLQLSLISRTKH